MPDGSGSHQKMHMRVKPRETDKEDMVVRCEQTLKISTPCVILSHPRARQEMESLGGDCLDDLLGK